MNERIAKMAEFLNESETHYFMTDDEDCLVCRAMAGGVKFEVEIATWEENHTLRFTSVFPVAVGEENAAGAILLANALNQIATFGTFTLNGETVLLQYRSAGELGGGDDPEVTAGMLFERHLRALSGAGVPLTLFALGVLTGKEAYERVTEIRVPSELLPTPEPPEIVRSN